MRANRIYVRFPGETELEIAGHRRRRVAATRRGTPRTGELAYVRRRSAEAEAEIVAVNPRAPGGERRLTAPGRSYTSPAFSPSGTLLALIAEDGSGYGGELCLETLPGDSPGCRADEQWRYGHPVFADDSTLYALRRSTATTRDGGWDELVRLRTDSFGVEARRSRTGDLRSVAVAARRPAGDRHPPAERPDLPRRGPLAPTASTTAIESAASATCAVAWSGDDLIVSRGACGGDEQIVQLDPRYLDATPTVLVAGDEPSVAP